MNALLKEHGKSRFDIVGFPCNQFGWQEPGHNKTEILNGLKYVRPGKGFEPAFNLMTKIEVNGDNETLLYTFLKKSCRLPSDAIFKKERLAWDKIKADDISWNFEKFLIDNNGVPLARFLPHKTPGFVVDLITPMIYSNSTHPTFAEVLNKRCQGGEKDFCNL